MRRYLIPAAVLALAAIAGGVVAGLPSAVADDVAPQALPAAAEVTTTTTTTLPPTTSTSSTTTTSTTVPQDEVRVVIGNAQSSRAVLDDATDELLGGGYTDLVIADGTESRATSIVLYNEGFERQATAVARLLGVDEVALHPFGAVTVLDEAGDVWVLVGRDLA